ncbi:hypothetical protein GCM10011534_15170 [Pseudooceanicola nanhaiensis]|jgi:uncharacterized membrane protein|uniref:DUF2244 domain-containing protein n=1 Tax=Pseudooceanicola nanhaiensis TaxID=375761 RepID=A0A917SQN6_9RHOB|nr:DUF2244 domain-containing protein [Pseudooceanicola nanhaiensis]GGL93972.1 hypothetical protein GCM10011534_15170 [Pseudooceanicola nanhaiensis]
MPYEWSDSRRHLTLWPYRSLPRNGFAAVIGLFFLLAMIPLFGLLGTVLLWGLLPFGLGALAALWFGLRLSYRSGEVVETLSISPERTRLLRRNPDGSEQSWECNTYWARVEMHLKGGPVPYYVTLNGNGRRVEIGAFLSEDERRALHGELASELAAQRS